ncbi:DUF1178 family protein [Corticibacter populi]|uniref:DUF1178 family protein n=1 Tax=Corticibacter populi TaxID=1550736 RepID=A0A3M6QXJ8_9BURK|nr:DUF1178 family protein [Corticibacter populi]RMX07631.1 DUF1178 family protein [Corticibacter populi]RZS30132.1 hypothetical protein EV687_3625 [Corticibacter populi]
MKVLDLRCDSGHVFEGWFASDDDYQSQMSRGLLQCPVCNSPHVGKTLSAPRLNAKSNTRSASAASARPEDALTPPGALHAAESPGPAQRAAMQARWLRQARELVRQAEDVGGNFPNEARRIHAGEAPERPIHGQASVGEMVELLQEGIAVLPLPDVVNEPVQ